MNRIRLDGGLNIIKRIAPSKGNNKVSENPFASNPFGISFKGKILKADIFEATAKPSIKETISQRGKMAASAIVGSLTDLKSAATQRLEQTFKPVVDFGRQVKAHANEIIDRVNKFDLTQFKVPNLNKEKAPNLNIEVEKLKQKPVTELEDMLKQAIPA